MKNVIAPKAYRNEAFLASEGARNIRILCECTESQQRLTEHGVSATVLFFGSARAKSKEHHAALVSENEAKLCTARADNNADDIAALEKRADELERSKWMTEYFSKVEELSKAITEWAMSPDVKLGPEHKTTGVTRYHDHIAALNMTSPPMSDENSVNFEDTDCLSITQAIVVFTGGGELTLLLYISLMGKYLLYVRTFDWLHRSWFHGSCK